MKKSWLLNLALLFAVAALGWFIHHKPAIEAAVYPLSVLKADGVSSIRLERSGRVPVVLEKKNALWFITAPIAAPAEPFQIERLLGILGAQASARLAANDLVRFDLDQPAAKLTVDTQTFSFGTISTLAREQYVLTQDAVYTVELRHGAALPADATQLIRRQLFASDEVPVSFEFADFTLRNNDGKWTVMPAAGLSQDDANRWVDHWRLASALRTEPYDRRKPQGEIRIEFKDGRKLALGILQREPELVLLRSDQNLQYSFFSEAAKRLLAPPGTTAKP